MNQLMSDWVTYREAASYLGVSISTIRAWCRKGLLDKRRLSHRVARISALSIERMMECAKEPKPKEPEEPVASSFRAIPPRK